MDPTVAVAGAIAGAVVGGPGGAVVGGVGGGLVRGVRRRGAPAAGTKHSLPTDGGGVLLALAVAGANVHDKRLVEPTPRRFAMRRPRPKRAGRKQHFCGDKGYDYPDIRTVVRRWGHTLHIKSRGEEARALRSHPRYRARRWVVEHSHSWPNRFRHLLIRGEKKEANYEAMLHFACAWTTLRAAGVLG